MSNISKEKTPKQIKREEKIEKLTQRRIMHKFQDKWRNLNIKYADRDIDRNIVM